MTDSTQETEGDLVNRCARIIHDPEGRYVTYSGKAAAVIAEVLEWQAEQARIAALPDRVSIHGMYDCHLFHKVTGATVDELIDNWLEHNANDPTERKLGPSALCPAAVLKDDKELRRVGSMVHVDCFTGEVCSPEVLEIYREELKTDPDIPRLLAGASKE